VKHQGTGTNQKPSQRPSIASVIISIASNQIKNSIEVLASRLAHQANHHRKINRVAYHQNYLNLGFLKKNTSIMNTAQFITHVIKSMYNKYQKNTSYCQQAKELNQIPNPRISVETQLGNYQNSLSPTC
jgi:hypothetical protein